jgi:hypothetical protein
VKIRYEDWNPGPDAQAVIAQADAICRDYAAQGYDLTLRQLYYQFVARDLIPNTQESYKRLGSIVNRARMAGLLDWNYIVDRTRNLRSLSHWDAPADIIRGAAAQFRIDKWAGQGRRVEVWVEKEALAGVVQRAADNHDVAWFSCRGYVSQSELWGAGQRLGRYLVNGQAVTILHLGDHDPSGIDMTRDIRDRLTLFLGKDLGYEVAESYGDDGLPEVEVRRIALNYDQVRQYNPPPNPAKLTDSRANGYIAAHGRQSWELDALDPATLNALVAEHIEGIQDPNLYHERQVTEEEHRELLSAASRRWRDVVALLDGGSR